MCRVFTVLLILLTFADIALAQRGGRGNRGGNGFGRGWEMAEKVKNPDKDSDYKVDTTELRNWVEAVVFI